MHSLKVSAIVLLGVGVLLFGLSQAFPWHVIDDDNDNRLLNGYLWGGAQDPDNSFNAECTSTWFGDFDCNGQPAGPDDGKAELKTGFVLDIVTGILVIGTVLGAVLHTGRHPLFGVLGLFASFGLMLTMIFFMVGFDILYDALSDTILIGTDLGVHAGLFLGFAALVCLVIGFLLDLYHDVVVLRSPKQAEPVPVAATPTNEDQADWIPADTTKLQCPSCDSMSVQLRYGEKYCASCGFDGQKVRYLDHDDSASATWA